MLVELSVTQYAKQLGLTRQAVLSQINQNRLQSNITAKKVGSTWILIISEPIEKK